MHTGETLKRDGLTLVIQSDAEWRGRAMNAIRGLAGGLEPFTSEDVDRIVGPPIRKNQMGAVLNLAARKKIIVRTGFVKSGKPSRHAAFISEWVGTEADHAKK